MRQNAVILVAEDDAADVTFLKRAFSQAGINVPLHFVRDGQEAIDYLTGEEPFGSRVDHPFPCLMLVDIKMPKLNGFDVLQWVRGQDELRRLPIVMLTTSNLDGDVNRAYDLGANSYLVKPNDLDDLGRLAVDLQTYWCKRNRGARIEL